MNGGYKVCHYMKHCMCLQSSPHILEKNISPMKLWYMETESVHTSLSVCVYLCVCVCVCVCLCVYLCVYRY